MKLGTTIILGALSMVLVPPAEAQRRRIEPASSATEKYQHPLDAKVSVSMKRVSLIEYFNEVGRQSKLRFHFSPGLEKCAVSAFLKERTARQALQAAMTIQGMTYSQMGRSDTYIITPRKDAPFCPVGPPLSRPFSTCKKLAGKGVSLDCTSAPLDEYAELVSAQTDGSFFFPNRADTESITTKIQGGTLKDAIRELGNINSVSVTESHGVFLVVARMPN